MSEPWFHDCEELRLIRERHNTDNRNWSGKIIFSDELHLADADRGKLLEYIDEQAELLKGMEAILRVKTKIMDEALQTIKDQNKILKTAHSTTCQMVVIGSLHCDCYRRRFCDCVDCIRMRIE